MGTRAGSGSALLYVHGVHKDITFIRDREPRTATSTFTQLLSSDVTQALDTVTVVDPFTSLL